MITAPAVALWLVQAPLATSGAPPPIMAPPREWNLAGAFTLKQEKFMQWQSLFDPNRPHYGFFYELRPTWMLELAPTRPQLKRVSLKLESVPAQGSGVGLVRPKLQYQIAGSSLHIGVMQTTYLFRTWDARTGRPIGPIFRRPMGFVSGRF